MPKSVRENSKDVREWVREAGVRTVLDVGPGEGTYARVLKKMREAGEVVLDAVEVWEPYVEKYGLTEKYRYVWVGDIRTWGGWEREEWDLVVFGDVLEHMSRDDALRVWKRASEVARFGLISVPVVHYRQGTREGNPYEAHVQEHLEVEDIRRDYGPFEVEFVYRKTGTFIKAF